MGQDLILELVALATAVLVAVFLSLQVVKPYETLVVLRLGKTDQSRVHGPGFAWLIPIVDRGIRIDMRERYVEFPSIMLTTSDGFDVAGAMRVFYRVVDAFKCVVNIGSLESGVTAAGVEVARRSVAESALSDLVGGSTRLGIAEGIGRDLGRTTERWGVTITTVEWVSVDFSADAEREIERRRADQPVPAAGAAERSSSSQSSS